MQADQAEVLQRAVSDGGDTSGELNSQRRAARDAGFSKRQEVQASRVAKIPEAEFEAEIERPGKLPTVTELATVETALRQHANVSTLPYLSRPPVRKAAISKN